MFTDLHIGLDLQRKHLVIRGHDRKTLYLDKLLTGERGDYRLLNDVSTAVSGSSSDPQLVENMARRVIGLVAPHVMKFSSVAEMRANYRPTKWLIRGWWPHPSYGMCAAGEKTLKSWLDTIENISVATGRPFLNKFDVVTPGPVVVFTGEGNRDLYVERLNLIARTLYKMSEEEIDTLQIYVTEEIAPTRTEIFQESLKAALEEYKPVKVTLDPLYSYHGSDVEAGNVHAAAEVLNAVSKLTQEAGVSLKIINHFRKDVSGSLSLHDITQAGPREWCDSWVLMSHRERPDLNTGDFHLQLVVGSRRWGGSSWDLEIGLGPAAEDGVGHKGPVTCEVSEGTADQSASDVKLMGDALVLTGLGEATAVQFAEAANISVDTARNRLKRLVAHGDFYEDQKHKPYVYRPAPAPV